MKSNHCGLTSLRRKKPRPQCGVPSRAPPSKTYQGDDHEKQYHLRCSDTAHLRILQHGGAARTRPPHRRHRPGADDPQSGSGTGLRRRLRTGPAHAHQLGRGLRFVPPHRSGQDVDDRADRFVVPAEQHGRGVLVGRLRRRPGEEHPEFGRSRAVSGRSAGRLRHCLPPTRRNIHHSEQLNA